MPPSGARLAAHLNTGASRCDRQAHLAAGPMTRPSRLGLPSRYIHGSRGRAAGESPASRPVPRILLVRTLSDGTAGPENGAVPEAVTETRGSGRREDAGHLSGEPGVEVHSVRPRPVGDLLRQVV